MFSLQNISTWPAQRWPWTLLFVSTLILELIALYFQYGMGLEPCVMCIYQRVALFGVLAASLVGMTAPTSLLVRLTAMAIWLVSAIWGFSIAFEHVQMQNPENFMLLMSCDVVPQFPDWLQLHQMLPSLFEPRGMCGDIDWSLFGLSMPQWMVVVFAVYGLLAISVLATRILKLKTL